RVSAGFFPPQPLGLAGQEEMTDQGDVPVAQERWILADLERREAEHAFLVLQGLFDRPACEPNMQPGFELVRQRIPDEEPFLFLRRQRIVRPQEVVTAEYLTATRQPPRSRRQLPDQGSPLGVLDMEGSPRLLPHGLGVMTKFLDGAGGMTRFGARIVEPTRHSAWNFHDLAAVALLQAGEELRLLGGPDICGGACPTGARGVGARAQVRDEPLLCP